MEDLPFTLPALRDAYANGASPVDVVDEVYRRIEAVNDPGIFIDLFDVAEARAAAAALGSYDASKPLWGAPFAIKDNIDAAGHATTAGCPAYAYEPDADAFVVAELKAAGAILIGKTNLDQFATGLVGVRTPWPAPKNAVDPSIVPGGSSGGSAVVVGHGIVTFALGTDTAGSGRVPAALHNLVGLKPTLGSLSATGLVPACRTLDTISIFALTVEDAHAALTAAAVYDESDAYARRARPAPIAAVPPSFRVAIPDEETAEFFGDAAQKSAFARDVETLRAAGAEIVPVDFTPFHDVAAMLYQGAWVAERYTVIEELLARDADAVHPVTRQIISTAEDLSAADAFRGFYRLQDLKRRAEPVLASVDLICVPSIPTFYSVTDLEEDPIVPNSNLGVYTNFVNLMDLCGVAVPTPARVDGRPGGVTLLAAAGRDGWLASVGVA
ncbi:MAG: allophanate hydrolase, partial [Pseudomonadota bacterium]